MADGAAAGPRREARPIAFVAGGAQQPAASDRHDAASATDPGEAAQPPLDLRERFREAVLGVPTGAPAQARKRKRSHGEAAVPNASNPPPAKLDAEQERAFRKVSGKGGFALNLLKKMGFQGRLGKDGRGISKPIEVVPRRQATAGLGAEGKERAAHVNEEVNVELFGTDADLQRLRRRREREREEREEERELEKLRARLGGAGVLSSAGRPARQTKTFARAVDIIEAEERRPDGEPGMVILDMRSGQERVLTDFTGLSAAPAADEGSGSGSGSGSSSDSSSSSGSDSGSRSDSDSDDEKAALGVGETEEAEELRELCRAIRRVGRGAPGRELAFNAKALRAAAESSAARTAHDVDRLGRAVASEEKAITSARAAKDELSRELDEITETWQCIQAAYSAATEEADLRTAWTRALRELRPVWDGLPGIQVFQHDEDVAALQIARGLLERWAAQAGAAGACSLAFETGGAGIPAMRDMLEAWVPFLRERAGAGTATVDHLLSQTLLVAAERELGRAWQAVAQERDAAAQRALRIDADEFGTALLGAMEPFVSPALLHEAGTRAVLPELEARVECWAPDSQSLGARLDLWIVPWVGLLRRPIRAGLHRRIRQRLVGALRSGRFASADALLGPARDLVLPWRAVLSAKTFERVVVEGVSPSLEALLGAMVVTPSSGPQDRAPLRCALAWADVLPKDELCALFEGAFFGRWLGALEEQLQRLAQAEAPGRASGLRGVAAWYRDWRAEMAPLIALGDARIEALLGRALGAMGAAAGLERCRATSAETRPTHGLDSVDEARKRRRRAAAAASAARATATKTTAAAARRASAAPEEMGTREFLHLVAPRLGTTFMRDARGRSNPAGLPIYELGEGRLLVIESEICKVAAAGRVGGRADRAAWKPTTLRQLLPVAIL